MVLYEEDCAVPVPYTSRLLSKIEVGKTLVIHGSILPEAQRFEVNFLSQCVEINEHQGCVPLHVNFRFDEKKLVLNSFSSGEWGKEERHSNPLKVESEFDLRVRVHEDKFEVWLNHNHVADYAHRIPFVQIDHLQVKGDVTLTGVHWGGQYFQMPVTTAFHGSSLGSGQRVYVYGIPQGNFSVNFVGENNDSLFHFNPRFSEKTIVRNSQINEAWGNEEREGVFPFKKGTAFDLVLHNEPYSIQIFFNGERIGTFAHRANPSTDYKALRIEGEVEITGIEVSHTNN